MIRHTRKTIAKTRGITQHRTTGRRGAATNPLTMHVKMARAAASKHIAAVVSNGSFTEPSNHPVCQPEAMATMPTMMRPMAASKDHSDRHADRGHRVLSGRFPFVSGLSSISNTFDKSSVMSYSGS